MYFDENILRIVYNLPLEADISEIKAKYLESCLESAIEALSVYEILNENLSSDFLEEAKTFRSTITIPDFDVDLAVEILDRLRSDEEFDNVYVGYINMINKNIIRKGLKRNPETLEDLKDYINALQDTWVIEYLQNFIVDLEDESTKVD